MATTFTNTSVYTDDVAVLAATTVAPRSMARGTLDLRTKPGAYLFAWVGRMGATALAAAVQVQVRRVLNNGTAAVGGTAGTSVSWASQTAASIATKVNANANAGGTTVGVASATGLVAGDTICIYDAAFARLEFARVSKVVSTTVTVDAPLRYAHASAQGDAVTRLADRFAPVLLPGGSLYEVVFDYGASTTGPPVVVLAKAQTYDFDRSGSL